MGPAGALILVGCCYSGPKGAGPIRSPPWFLHGPPPLEESDLSTTALNRPPPPHHLHASLGSSWQLGLDGRDLMQLLTVIS